MGNGKNTQVIYELRSVEEYIFLIAPMMRYLRVILNLSKQEEDLYQNDFSLLYLGKYNQALWFHHINQMGIFLAYQLHGNTWTSSIDNDFMP